MLPDSPYQIETNAHDIALPLPVERLEEAARAVLISEKIDAAEISLAIVNGEQMRELNKRHLEHDYDTDVLSFLLESSDSPHETSLEGEVIVSIDMAGKQAREHGTDVNYELLLYVVHGTLHLCGYDDLTREEAIVMRKREREVLQKLLSGNTRPGQPE